MKSLCCELSFGSTWPCTGLRSVLPLFAEDGSVVVCGCGAALDPDAPDVAGRGWLRSHAARKARENARTAIVVIFIQASMS